MFQNELHKLIPTGLFKLFTFENLTEDFSSLSYHVTNHPIDNKNVFDPSVTTRCVIWAKESRIFTTGSEMGPGEVFLISWIFPDLLIGFCENQCFHPLYSHIDKREFMQLLQIDATLRNGPRRKFFGYLHCYRNWWRHSYESWFMNSKMESLNYLPCHKY